MPKAVSAPPSLSPYSPVTWFCLLDWICFKDAMDVHANTGADIILALNPVTECKWESTMPVIYDMPAGDIWKHLYLFYMLTFFPLEITLERENDPLTKKKML